MTKTIEIIVTPEGSLVIEAVGFQGTGCQEATRFLEEALGNMQQREKKPEFHTATRRANQQTQGT